MTALEASAYAEAIRRRNGVIATAACKRGRWPRRRWVVRVLFGNVAGALTLRTLEAAWMFNLRRRRADLVEAGAPPWVMTE